MHTAIVDHKSAYVNQDFMEQIASLMFAVTHDVKMEESVLLDI
jgi:hypothetical protein